MTPMPFSTNLIEIDIDIPIFLFYMCIQSKLIGMAMAGSKVMEVKQDFIESIMNKNSGIN